MRLQENYAMGAVREDLERLLTDEQQAVGGFKIYTTIDPVLQRAGEASLDTRLRKIEQRTGYPHPKRADFGALPEADKQQTPYLQGAVMVIDNATGGVRAIVGGRNYGESQYNRAREAERQIGSTFKPFVYAAAFGRGMLPGARISDNRIEPGEIAVAPTWNPGNSDGKFKGAMPAAAGLIESRNTMSIRVGERATLNEVVRVGRAAGLSSTPARPGIYLGDFETSLWNLTSAYTTFPNRGLERPAYLIERIDNSLGETIYQAPRLAPQVLDPGVCWLITSVLEAAMERGTGASVKALGFKQNCAGKTGTTNDYRDAWFVGFTTSLTCGVWVGMDQPKTISSGGYGASLALPVWADILRAAPPRQYPARDFAPPGGSREVVVCSISNELATAACEGASTAYRTELPPSCVPNDPCHVHQGSVVSSPSPRATKARNPAQGLLRSFRKFFGGK
jgi:penicillin-binding protein 1A